MNLLRVGTLVKVSDKVNPKFASRPGKVVSLYFDKKVLEYGLSFGKSSSPEAWFLPNELESLFPTPEPKPLSGLDFPV